MTLAATEPTITLHELTERDLMERAAGTQAAAILRSIPVMKRKGVAVGGSGFAPGESYLVLKTSFVDGESLIATAVSDAKGRLCEKAHDETLVPFETVRYEVCNNFAGGENVTFTVKRLSNGEEVTTQYCPYPLQASDADGRHIRLTVSSPDNMLFTLSLRGFKDGEEVYLSSSSCDEVLPPQKLVIGQMPNELGIAPAVTGRNRGNASITITPAATGKPLKIYYAWGR